LVGFLMVDQQPSSTGPTNL